MKKTYLVLLVAGVALFSSCSYNGAVTPPPVTTTDSSLVTFKKDFHSQFDVFVVDTADKNNNNADKILTGTRKSLAEIVVDTGLTYNGKSHVARVVTYDSTTTPKNDTNYFYQDPNGDLYRYNFGFNILNEFQILVQAIGKPVDVGWVLAAKMKSATGTPWVAKPDSPIYVAFLNVYVHLSSTAQMMADTTIQVGTETLKCRHARLQILASVPQGALGKEDGSSYVDTYICPAIGAVPLDFYHRVVLSGTLTTSQAQGKFKLMTSHQ